MKTAPQSRSSLISKKLEELILDGTLQPGDKVPSERQLAERLQASRALIREALKELRGRGVIDTQHGKGSFVVGMVEVINSESPLTKLYDSHPRLLYDLLDVRELLEGQAAALAAERATPRDIYRIRNAFEAMNAYSQAPNSQSKSQVTQVAQLATDPLPDNLNKKKENKENKDSHLATAAQLDHTFHKTIYEASHNPILIHTLQSLMQLMLNSVMASVNNLYHRNRQKQDIDKQHQMMFIAITEGNIEGARQAATEHIRSIRDRMSHIEREEERLIRAKLWKATE